MVEDAKDLAFRLSTRRRRMGSVDLKKKNEKKNKLTSEAEGAGRAKRCGKVSEVILDFALVKGWG